MPSASPTSSDRRWFRLRQDIYAAAVIIFAATVLGKAFGMARDVLIARYYGASNLTDAFYMALTIPALVAASLGLAMGNALVAVGAQVHAHEGGPSARRFYHMCFQTALIIGALTGALTAGLARPIIAAVGHGLSPPAVELATTAVRILGAWIVTQVLYYVLFGIFQSQKHFLAPALAQLIEPVAVSAALVATRTMSWPNALAISWLVGGTSVVVVFFACFLFAFRYRVVPSLRSPHIDAMLLLALPLMIASILQYMNTAIDRTFVRLLPEGGVTALNFAFVLISAPLYFVVLPASIAALPFLSDLAVKRDTREIHNVLDKFTRLAIAGLVPVSAFLFVYAPAIVRLIFEHGAFDATATAETASAVRGFAFALLPLGEIYVLTRTLNAVRRARGVLYGATAGVVVKLLLSILLVRRFSLLGLALATSASSVAAWLLMSLLLRGRIGSPDRPLPVRLVLGSLGATGVALGALGLLDTYVVNGWIVWKGLLFVALFLATYAAVAPSEWHLIRDAFQSLTREPASIERPEPAP